MMAEGVLDIDGIRESMRGAREGGQPGVVGRWIECIPTTTSSNDAAWAGIDDAQAHGLVIFTEYQSAGRGRLGRSWQSHRGASLLCSLLLTDKGVAAKTGGTIGLAAAVAACDAVNDYPGVSAMIKWPNDLMAGGKKLGGILVESRKTRQGRPCYVVGIGINCLQQRAHFGPDLADLATSLELLGPRAVDRTAVAIRLLTELDRWLGGGEEVTPDCVQRAWLARAEPLGQRVVLRSGGCEFRGALIDLDPSAAMVVELDEGGVRAFDLADTTVLKSGF